MEKVIKRTQETFYKCGVCGRTYTTKQVALHCEQQDRCKHESEKLEFTLKVEHERWVSLIKRCSFCGKRYEEIEITKILKNDIKKYYLFFTKERKELNKGKE